MPLPEKGLSTADVIERLRSMREGDARWQDGRTFGLVFDGGPDVHEVAAAAQQMFLHENALSPIAFPSLGQIQREVCEAMADLLHGPEAAGFLTSGGTESILVAVKAARERGLAERGIERGEIVLPTSAHAAFHKAAHEYAMTIRSVDVADDFRADVDAMADAITDRTVLVVGSAPQYPQGVIDPIEELAALASEVGASFHTDACMGGFVLPFMERLGEEVPAWDFRVPGVTTISLDVHKLGYAPKGASIILHRTRELRRYQTFVFDQWLGGLYASPNLQGSRSGAPMAAAWAVMHHLGLEGYDHLTRVVIDTTRRMLAGIREVEGLRVLGSPDAHCLAIASDPASSTPLDVFALGDALNQRRWYHDRQSPPDSLHATVSAGNAPVVDRWLEDLHECADLVRGERVDDRSTRYAGLE